jgi:hypothetical protein
MQALVRMFIVVTGQVAALSWESLAAAARTHATDPMRVVGKLKGKEGLELVQDPEILDLYISLEPTGTCLRPMARMGCVGVFVWHARLCALGGLCTGVQGCARQ